ncbi:MAG: hypothetical protein AAF086_02305 [Planctomycetota bacterium]
MLAISTPSLATAEAAYPPGGAVMLPAKLEKSALGDLVFASQFDRAIAEADRQMKGRVTAELMYLRAMACLGKAERSRAADDYKDAGLDFMRVVVYFPSSSYASPSLLEVAFVHDRLGLSAKADELYAQARQALKVEDHPRYVARCKQLSGA